MDRCELVSRSNYDSRLEKAVVKLAILTPMMISPIVAVSASSWPPQTRSPLIHIHTQILSGWKNRLRLSVTMN